MLRVPQTVFRQRARRAKLVCPWSEALTSRVSTWTLGTRFVHRILYAAGLLLLCYSFAQGENPCEGTKQRALVLGGGGVKGAFETGAVYHLVVHRGCDFSEFSGVSVGALNAVFLAQAKESKDSMESHRNLVDQTVALVSLWQSIRSSKDVAPGRPLATLRWGLWGLESLNDFQPLYRLLEKNISLEKLATGRAVRVGVVSFSDGKYREVLAKPMPSGSGKVSFLDFVYASTTPPVYGTLPRIPDGTQGIEARQFGDGSVRHITPVRTYFISCPTRWSTQGEPLTTRSDKNWDEDCEPRRDSSLPAHEAIQQLFVIVTSPYSRGSDFLPVNDPKCCRPGSLQITDGRKILGRTLELMDDSIFRGDLDFLLSTNDILRWRWQAYQSLIFSAPHGHLAEAKRESRGANNFVPESYNRDSADPNVPSRPYDLGLVVPEQEFADVKSLLKVSQPPVQEQLYCGCVAADQMMQKEFGLSSQGERCAQRFPRSLQTRENLSPMAADWDPTTCHAKMEVIPETNMAARPDAECVHAP